MVSSTARLLAMLIYLISFFTAFLGPLVIWLLKKSDSNFVDYHGREYLNFFISYTVYGFISAILTVILIGYLLGALLGIAAFIFTIIAAVKAYSGEFYRFPFIFRIL